MYKVGPILHSQRNVYIYINTYVNKYDTPNCVRNLFVGISMTKITQE